MHSGWFVFSQMTDHLSMQHLRIKSFFGTSENAVRTRIRIAVTVYVLKDTALVNELSCAKSAERFC